MRKIFKKSLAVAVSTALCLTAFIGCLSANAEEDTPATTTPSYEFDKVQGAPGDTVSFNLVGTNLTEICAQGIDVTIPKGLTLKSIKNGETVLNETDGTNDGDYHVQNNEAEDTVVKFVDFLNFGDEITTTNLTLTFEVEISADAEVDTVYNITLDGDYATYEETFLENVNVVNGTVTVKSAEQPCEHEWEIVEAVPATAEANGSITFKCAKCDEEKAVTVVYYDRYKCFTSNASYESAITLDFSVRKDRLADQGDYTDCFVRFEHSLSTGSIKETYQKIDDASDTTKNSRPSKTWSYPVKSTQFTETINTNVFVEFNGVWYNGATFGYSVRSYADTVLPTISDTEKALVVNMLRYGSKMQTFKAYNIENLADAGLAQEYASLINESIPEISGMPAKESDSTDAIYILSSSFSLDMASRTEAKLRLRSDRYTASPAKDDFTIVATWTNAKGAQRSVTYYNEAYAPEGVETVYSQDPASANAGRYAFSFAELPGYDLRQVVTFNIYDGENEVSQKFSASVVTLLNYGITNGAYGTDELNVYYAMINYSDSAREHFCP